MTELLDSKHDHSAANRLLYCFVPLIRLQHTTLCVDAFDRFTDRLLAADCVVNSRKLSCLMFRLTVQATTHFYI